MDFPALKMEGLRRDSLSCALRLSLNAERAKRRSAYLFTALACGGNSTSKYGRRQNKNTSIQSASVGSSFMKNENSTKNNTNTEKTTRNSKRATPTTNTSPCA